MRAYLRAHAAGYAATGRGLSASARSMNMNSSRAGVDTQDEVLTLLETSAPSSPIIPAQAFTHSRGSEGARSGCFFNVRFRAHSERKHYVPQSVDNVEKNLAGCRWRTLGPVGPGRGRGPRRGDSGRFSFQGCGSRLTDGVSVGRAQKRNGDPQKGR